MSIKYQIPTQSRFIATSTIFSAVFNAVTPAKYDFANTTANQNVIVLRLQPGTIYLIERLSVGGNITESQFLESIDTFPVLTIKRSSSRESVYSQGIPIVHYFDGLECAAWVHSDKNDDDLTLSLSGLLSQLPSMIGILTARIQVSLSIYAIESSYFSGSFRDVLSTSIGQTNRR